MTNRILACVLTFSVACLATAQNSEDARFAAETRDYLQRLEKFGFAGTVLVARGGRPLLAEGFGLADRENNVPWTPGTVSDTGSITKQFTATAILKLAEEGRLAVNDPLAKYFDGVPEDKRAITLHQLLTHSSGIVDLAGAGDWDAIERDDFVRRIFAQPLDFQPGQGYGYSNAGYSLLGAIIEKLSGQSYEQFMREQFFIPLGLYETGYVLAPWGKGRLAQGYRGAERWGTTIERPMAADGPYWVLRANGGIHMPAWDMLRWTRALTEGRVLSNASLERMWQPHVREGADADTFYGYGWSIQDHGGLRVVTHNGSNGIFYADLALIPESNTVIYLMTNVASANRYTRSLLENLGLRLMAGRPYPDVPRVVAADATRLAALAGDWTLAGGGRIRATPDTDAIVLEPLDAQAFAGLLSRPALSDADRKLAEQRGQLLLAAARAMLAKDFTRLQQLYGESVSLQTVTRNWTERLTSIAERHGAARSVELVGFARRDRQHFFLLRFHGERGHQDFTFDWEGASDGRLRGLFGPGIETRLRFHAEAAGNWAAFDRSSGESVPMRLEEGRLVIGRGEAAIKAERTANERR